MPLFSATNQERPYEQLVHNWHNFVYPSNSKIYGQEPPYNEHRYSEHILPVP